MEYLDFELPVQELEEQLNKCQALGEENGLDVKQTCLQLEQTIIETKEKIYGNLTPWQKVRLSRHPNRPYTLDYLEAITDGTFIELHGDRTYADDKAMVGGLGQIDNQTFMFVGQQKGKNTKQRQMRRFGMSNPEGYRKALRLMQLAEKFNVPVVTFIDTPGAYPGLEAEERGQGEAIAKNIYEMLQLKVPVVSIIIGEGASGGALGIGVGDKVLMLENTWYSVISPENCSAILWRSWEHKETAAESMKLTSDDMVKLGLIDGIIKEPLGGAHYEPNKAFKEVRKRIQKELTALSKLSTEELIKTRQEKFMKMGEFKN